MVTISKAAFEGMRKHCETDYPNEACGVMTGKGGSVTGFAACRNDNKQRARDRYELNQSDFFKADEDAKNNNLGIVGIYHSHPDNGAYFSQTDKKRAEALKGWDFLYLVLSIQKGVFSEAGAWRLNEQTGQFEEVVFSGCD